MKRSRRTLLRNASKLSAVFAGLGASSAATAQEDDYPEWDPDAVYTSGDRVVYDGSVWEAQWWTRGNEPGASEWGPWEEVEPIDDDPDPEPPELTANVDASATRVEVGAEVELDGSGSTGDIESYAWQLGDGTEATGETVTHAYAESGEYTVELTVTDADGNADTARLELAVRDEIEGPDDDFKVIGYYPGWKANDEHDYYPSDIPFEKVTDVLYAFIDLDENGNVFPPEDGTEFDVPHQTHEENLEEFAALADEVDCRFHLSIGGWTLSENFHVVAADPELRRTFAENSVALMREYDFDGIDIDWEHPGPQQGECQCGNDDDYDNHVLLLEALREELDAAGEADGQHYYLSVANGGSDWNAGGLRHGEIGDVCDHAMVMAYDFTGEWHDAAGLNAPIYGDEHPLGTSEYGEDYHDQYYVEYAVDELWAGDHTEEGYWPGQWQYPPAEPAEYDELVLGMPFYGRGFNNATEPYDGIGFGPDVLPEGTWHHLLEEGEDPTGAFDFGDLEENYEGADGWEKHRHDPGAVPYLVNEDEETFISYDDRQSIAEKVEFAKERGMAGVMFWELSQDWNETLLETILETI